MFLKKNKVLQCRIWKTDTLVFELGGVRNFQVTGTTLAIVTNKYLKLFRFPSMKVKFSLEDHSQPPQILIAPSSYTAFCAQNRYVVCKTNGGKSNYSLSVDFTVAFDVQDDYLVGITEYAFYVRNLFTKTILANYPFETRAKNPCVRIAGKYFYATMGGAHQYNLVKFDLATGSIAGVLRGHSDVITHIQVGKKHVYSMAADLTMRVWDLETDQQVHVLAAKQYSHMALSNMI